MQEVPIFLLLISSIDVVGSLTAVGPKSVSSYFSDIVLCNSEYNFTRSPSKSRRVPSYLVFDAFSASNKSSTVKFLKIQQV